MTLETDALLRILRGAGEATRLRLLQVLAHGSYTVTELTQIFGQSQPRLSRQLKAMCDSGLLQRSRDQHWVYYRAVSEGPAAPAVRALLGLLDPRDTIAALDLERARELVATRSAAAEPRGPGPALDQDARELAAFIAAELADRACGSLLYLGLAAGDVLAETGALAREAVVVNDEPDRRRATRARLLARGVTNCLVQRQRLTRLSFPTHSFGVVIVDRIHADEPHPVDVLREAARVLHPSGRLLLVEDHDRFAGAEPNANPLHAVRERLTSAGLQCERLRPLDADGRHLLLASATSTADAADDTRAIA